MKTWLVAALLGTTALTVGGAPALAQVAECDALVAFVRDNDPALAGLSQERAAELAAAADAAQCNTELAAAQARIAQAQPGAPAGTATQTTPGAAPAAGTTAAPAEGTTAAPAAGAEGTGAQIVVEQPQPTVTVQQPQAQVSVQQGQPNIIVRQAQPTVRVQMPQPVITIDMPRPEIIVQMPQPSVSVDQAQPQVSVQQAQPTVRVEQAEQPAVQVQQGAAAQVSVTEAQPTVSYEAAEPAVSVENTGQPTVQFNQTGEATVQIQQMGADGTMAPAAGQPAATDAAGQGAMAPAADQTAVATAPAATDQAAQPAATAPATDQTAAATAPAATDAAAMQMMPVSITDLRNMEVYGENNEEIGEVDRVVRSGNETYVIVGAGGFLGLGERRVPLPLSQMYIANDRLIMPGVTKESVEQMAQVDASGFADAVDTETVQITRR